MRLLRPVRSEFVASRSMASLTAALFAIVAALPTIPGVREWHPGRGEVHPAGVVLSLGSHARRLGSEGYRLEVGSRVRIEARTRAGLFYGRQTVRQLLRAGHGAIPRGW